jgi:CubicO group peptidase (beta-lactamase class C family)
MHEKLCKECAEFMEIDPADLQTGFSSLIALPPQSSRDWCSPLKQLPENAGPTLFPFPDVHVRRRMQEMHIPGLSLAVVKDGKVIKAAGYGLANVETKTPATAETVYKTASLSKPVIAAAVMLLVQDGRVGLDDKISRYLDDSPGTWKK